MSEERNPSDEFNVLVAGLNGIIHTIPMKPTDTVSQLKLKIEEKETIPPMEQKLSFNGLQLRDKRTLKFHKIENGSIIQLDRKTDIRGDSGSGVASTSSVSTGSSAAPSSIIASTSSASTDPIAARVPNIPSTGPSKPTIIVRAVSGLILKIEIQNDETVEAVKVKIQGLLKVPIANQRLLFAGRELEDHRLLTSYKIQDGTTLTIAIRLNAITAT